VADSFHNLGNVYLSQGKCEEGLETHMKSLDIKTRIYSDRHLLVADTLTSMAIRSKASTRRRLFSTRNP
jgi:hypothetical protein